MQELEPQKIWLSTPHMGGQELKYIHDAFDHNWVAPLGPNIDGFEQTLAEYVGGDVHVAVLCSGTAALHLAMIACGVARGDEVICQSMTFSASANPIMYQGATPIFVDSETDTWNMSPQVLEDAIKDRLARGKKPKAIVAVHLYGMPCKMDEILDIADRYEIPVIEDAAEALGATYMGRPTGTFGRFGILSFNGNKIITTSGGGALISHNAADRAHAVYLATQARDAAPHYQHSQVGFNYRMSNICAGIGRGQMEVLSERLAARRAIHDFYANLFKDAPGVRLLEEPNEHYYSNHWLTAILVDPHAGGKSKHDLLRALAQENIEARPLWKPLHMQPVFAGAPYYGGHVAEMLFETGLCLPSGSNLTAQQLGRITAVVDSVFGDERPTGRQHAVPYRMC